MMHLLILLVKQHAALALEGLHDKGIEIMLGQRVNYEGLLEGFNGQNQLILTFSLRSLIFEFRLFFFAKLYQIIVILPVWQGSADWAGRVPRG